MTEVSAVWSEWGRITRFLNSTQIALARERRIWESLEVSSDAEVTLQVKANSREYTVRLEQHLEAVADVDALHAAVLIQSYAVAEAAACDHLSLDQRSARGIEHWGWELLTRNGCSWADVHGDRSGIVEVAVARDAYAHGTHVVDATAANRLASAGSTRWSAGTHVVLSAQDVMEFRDRLRSLLRLGAVR